MVVNLQRIGGHVGLVGLTGCIAILEFFQVFFAIYNLFARIKRPVNVFVKVLCGFILANAFKVFAQKYQPDDRVAAFQHVQSMYIVLNSVCMLLS